MSGSRGQIDVARTLSICWLSPSGFAPGMPLRRRPLATPLARGQQEQGTVSFQQLQPVSACVRQLYTAHLFLSSELSFPGCHLLLLPFRQGALFLPCCCFRSPPSFLQGWLGLRPHPLLGPTWSVPPLLRPHSPMAPNCLVSSVGKLAIVLGSMDRARWEKPAEALEGKGIFVVRSWEGHCGHSAEGCGGLRRTEAAWVRTWALESHFLSVGPGLTAPMQAAS